MNQSRRLAISMTLLATTGALCFNARVAAAQTGNQAAAEALFQEGRALYEQQRYAEACPKLAESQRTDPGTGTLLTLALCHEKEGKLASAWAEFATVEGEARNASRQDRVTIAREHAAAIRPRLSTLAVDVLPGVAATPGLELRIDGAVIGSGAFGVAVPVDGGEHRVEASAPGKKHWQQLTTVKVEADAVRVSIPVLEDLPKEAAPTAATPEVVSVREPEPSGSGMRTAGLIVAGAGVAALGVGGYLALDAKSDHSDAKKLCQPSPPSCGDEAYQAGEDARSQGTLATVLFAVGGAALATGGVLWLLAPSGKEQAPATSGLRLERLGIAPSGVALQGSF